jgi:hypothetical protein
MLVFTTAVDIVATDATVSVRAQAVVPTLRIEMYAISLMVALSAASPAVAVKTPATLTAPPKNAVLVTLRKEMYAVESTLRFSPICTAPATLMLVLTITVEAVRTLCTVAF